MKKIVFATNNPNKIREISFLLPSSVAVASLQDINCYEEIPETSATIEGNALQKARFVSQKYLVNCFAEDTGLEVEALQGEPGVLSARYAGPSRSAEANMKKVLSKLGENPNRKARFKTVIALILDGEEHTFEGVINGNISFEKRGTGGFGYDPIFVPAGSFQSFAEMTMEQINKISHRARAMAEFRAFLNTIT